MAKRANKERDRDADGLQQRALRARAAGDFAQARRLFAALAQREPASTDGQAAAAALAQMGLDPQALGYGAAAMLLYAIAWVLALHA